MHIKGDQRCSGTAASAMSLRVVSARIAAGEVTPVEHVDEVLESLDSLAGTPWANLVSARNDDRARREAELHTARIASGRGRGPLDGIAVAVKDNIDVEGMPTGLGSDYGGDRDVANRDADIVTRLRARGAIVVAKTHLHELAYGSTRSTNASGPARNPHDPDRITGGSPSGSAALTALGVVPLAIGTDTGCSVRAPAALCGVAGLMPALGTLSNEGVVPVSPTFDHAGLLAGRTRRPPDELSGSGGLRNARAVRRGAAPVTNSVPASGARASRVELSRSRLREGASPSWAASPPAQPSHRRGRGRRPGAGHDPLGGAPHRPDHRRWRACRRCAPASLHTLQCVGYSSGQRPRLHHAPAAGRPSGGHDTR